MKLILPAKPSVPSNQFRELMMIITQRKAEMTANQAGNSKTPPGSLIWSIVSPAKRIMIAAVP